MARRVRVARTPFRNRYIGDVQRREKSMEQDPTTFAQIIARDRAKSPGEAWHGRFIDYLERVRQDPGLTRLAHARLYDIVMRAGARDINCGDRRAARLFGDERLKVYQFFNDEFFGIEGAIA